MPYQFDTVEKFFVLLFGAIVVGIIVTNPGGVAGIFQGLANFTGKTVGAFAGSQGFAGRATNVSSF